MADDRPLSNEQVSTIVAEYYRTRQAKTTAQTHPTMVLIGAQPGAGKTRAAYLMRQTLKDQGGFIHVDADRMRLLLPAQALGVTSEQTQADAGRLVGALRNLAIEGRRNIIEEGTFSKSDGAAAFIADKKARGYQVELVAVATPPEISLQSIYKRFEQQHRAGNSNPRFVPPEYHNQALAGFLNTVEHVGPQLDRLRVINRQGDFLYDSRTQALDQAIPTLLQAQQLTPRAVEQLVQDWQGITTSAKGRGAPVEYLQSINQYSQGKSHVEMQRATTLDRVQIETTLKNQGLLVRDAQNVKGIITGNVVAMSKEHVGIKIGVNVALVVSADRFDKPPSLGQKLSLENPSVESRQRGIEK